MATEIKFPPQNVTNPFTPSLELLPPYDEIPEEFRRFPGTKWHKLFSDWFFIGLKSLELKPKDGIDREKALKHIKVAMSGFDSKHEHKEAGVAYLMSLWFEDARWVAGEANR